MEKGCGRALGLAEERTQARGRLFLGDFLFFLLFLFLLLFFLLGGRRCRGSGGRDPRRGPPGPRGVFALPPRGPGPSPSLLRPHPPRPGGPLSGFPLFPPSRPAPKPNPPHT